MKKKVIIALVSLAVIGTAVAGCIRHTYAKPYRHASLR